MGYLLLKKEAVPTAIPVKAANCLITEVNIL